jgi:glyoxylase-like metal-dependent hydrolase (beta-lactamase superfamily II)
MLDRLAMRHYVTFAVIAVAGAAVLSAQVVSSGQNLDTVLASSKGEVRTGENLKLPASGDWHARWKDSDFPVITKVAENVYLYQGPHSTQSGWLINSLIVITTDGVVVLDGQQTAQGMARMVDEVKKLTPQPIKYIVVGSTHADHGEFAFGTMPGVEKVTFVGHAITKVWFEADAKVPDRAGNLRNIPAITEVVGSLPVDPAKPAPRVTKVLKVGGTEFRIMYMGRGHAGPDLVTYLPKEKILWLSESFETRQFPSMGDSSYPSEWIAILKEAAQMKNVDNYLGAHGFMDSPAINKQELLNSIRVIQAIYAEAKRLHDQKIPIEEVPNHWHFGENAHLFFNEAALPDVTAIYMELDGKLPPCPPCRPRRFQGDKAQAPAE